jgi:hypothetical protein
MLDFSALLGFSRCGPGSWSATTSRTHRIETISTLLAIIPKWSGQVRRLFDDQFNSFITSKSLQPHTKLGADWPSVTAVVREASHSSTMYATIAQCEFKSAMSIGSKKKMQNHDRENLGLELDENLLPPCGGVARVPRISRKVFCIIDKLAAITAS